MIISGYFVDSVGCVPANGRVQCVNVHTFQSRASLKYGDTMDSVVSLDSVDSVDSVDSADSVDSLHNGLLKSRGFAFFICKLFDKTHEMVG